MAHGGFPQNSRNNDEHEIFTNPIKVMVVDNNKRFLYVVAKVLNYFSFEVTPINHGGTALAILCRKVEKFDLVLIDSSMSDVDAHTFLRLIRNMDLQAILMKKEDDDEQTLLKAFKDGALLVLKRPLTADRIRLLRQHAIRKRIQNLNSSDFMDKFGQVDNLGNPNDANTFPGGLKEEPIVYNDEHIACESVSSRRKNKTRIIWTPELHEKFMDAIGQLGEERCFPKLIHKLMKVPGLSRAQVSSHLQAIQRKAENRKA